jgi:hypothetical protein
MGRYIAVAVSAALVAVIIVIATFGPLWNAVGDAHPLIVASIFMAYGLLLSATVNWIVNLCPHRYFKRVDGDRPSC